MEDINTNVDSKPYRCPVCGGNGLVPNGYYTSISGYINGPSTTSIMPDPCRTCNGTGMVWSNKQTKSNESK